MRFLYAFHDQAFDQSFHNEMYQNQRYHDQTKLRPNEITPKRYPTNKKWIEPQKDKPLEHVIKLNINKYNFDAPHRSSQDNPIFYLICANNSNYWLKFDSYIAL